MNDATAEHAVQKRGKHIARENDSVFYARGYTEGEYIHLCVFYEVC